MSTIGSDTTSGGGRLAAKVALITGEARGRGRSHAVPAPELTAATGQEMVDIGLTGAWKTVPDADQALAATAMWVDPVAISDAVAWLASDEARHVTGVALPVDGGMTAPCTIPHATG